MVMTSIKIISNPYLRQITFQKQHEDSEWENITINTDPNSKLLNDEIRTGFFPFIVKKITDILLAEYADDDDALQLVFEGTGDEYNELKAVCDEEEYAGRISLQKSDLYLENARDILPEIREIYKDIEVLINSPDLEKSEQLKREIKKFIDASSDQIPICVLGNYSTGKSTFINALIGCELLPSGDEPITGKIYKISNTKQADRGRVCFTINNKHVEIRLEDDEFRFRQGEMGNELIQELYNELSNLKGMSIVEKTARILELIEKYVKDHPDCGIEDLIEVFIPFGRGLWNETLNNFVVFDTPGSNSASNVEHVRVLKKAMEDMSNGMPIFISEYNSLDSTDNEKLYKDIKAMQELDSRFTMIIVNKADEADLEEEEGKVGLSASREKRLLSLAIPKNLYGEGVFFVSSIMGLGTKINEQFSDKHYLRVYSRSKNEYSDPLDPLYQRLYRYNIMPEQLKRKSIEQAEQCNDLVYANSGLFSVEEEIQTFGDKYSSYNKCFQSDMFLRKVIDLTFESIQKKKENRELSKKRRLESLEKDKQELVNKITEANKENAQRFEEQYPENMQQYVDEMIQQSFEDDLSDERKQFIGLQETELNVSEYMEKHDLAGKAVVDNLTTRLKNTFENLNIKNFVGDVWDMGTGFVDDYLTAKEEGEELEAVRLQAVRNAEQMLVTKKNHDYVTYSLRAISYLYDQSKSYWDKKSDEIKEILSQIVTGSSALTTERKEELAKIIISYQNIEYFLTKDLIENNKFDKDRFLNKILLWKTADLNLKHLKDEYNKEIKDSIEKTYESVKKSHADSYKEWIENLETIILENIVEFNPELHSQNEVIKDDTRAIAELQSRQETLTEYKEEISAKMYWKS